MANVAEHWDTGAESPTAADLLDPVALESRLAAARARRATALAARGSDPIALFPDRPSTAVGARPWLRSFPLFLAGLAAGGTIAILAIASPTRAPSPPLVTAATMAEPGAADRGRLPVADQAAARAAPTALSSPGVPPLAPARGAEPRVPLPKAVAVRATPPRPAGFTAAAARVEPGPAIDAESIRPAARAAAVGVSKARLAAAFGDVPALAVRPRARAGWPDRSASPEDGPAVGVAFVLPAAVVPAARVPSYPVTNDDPPVPATPLPAPGATGGSDDPTGPADGAETPRKPTGTAGEPQTPAHPVVGADPPRTAAKPSEPTRPATPAKPAKPVASKPPKAVATPVPATPRPAVRAERPSRPTDVARGPRDGRGKATREARREQRSDGRSVFGRSVFGDTVTGAARSVRDAVATGQSRGRGGADAFGRSTSDRRGDGFGRSGSGRNGGGWGASKSQQSGFASNQSRGRGDAARGSSRRGDSAGRSGSGRSDGGGRGGGRGGSGKGGSGKGGRR